MNNLFRAGWAARCRQSIAILILMPAAVQAGDTRPPEPEGGRKQRSRTWQVLETSNFRFHYEQELEDLPGIADDCEQKRLEILKDWLAVDDPKQWSPKCDVYLHATPAAYQRRTGHHPSSLGYANLEIGNGRVWERRLDLRADVPECFTSVIHHELTHVVLADRFTRRQIPRWADEGIAVLVEPPGRRDELAEVLQDALTMGRLFPVRDILYARDYPDDALRSELFYAQSVSLTHFLSQRQSRAKFIRFLEVAQQDGTSQAMNDVLGLKSTSALETEWKAWLNRSQVEGAQTAMVSGDGK